VPDHHEIVLEGGRGVGERSRIVRVLLVEEGCSCSIGPSRPEAVGPSGEGAAARGEVNGLSIVRLQLLRQ
jgi:hypothetical protein